MLLEPVLHDRLLRRLHLVEPPDRPVVRRLLQQLRALRRLARDREHRVAERVERLLRLGLGRLDHQRLGDDQREVDRRRVEAVVHQPLGDVERGDAVLALQVARREHELVHAEPVERQVVRVLEPREHVVRVQHGHLRHLAEPRPVHADERVRADEDAERAGEAAHLADRLRPVEVEAERLAVPRTTAGTGRYGSRMSRTAIGPPPGPPPPCGCENVLCRLMWTMSKPMSPGPRDPADGVQVRAVVVHERAGAVEDLARSPRCSRRRARAWTDS